MGGLICTPPSVMNFGWLRSLRGPAKTRRFALNMEVQRLSQGTAVQDISNQRHTSATGPCRRDGRIFEHLCLRSC